MTREPCSCVGPRKRCSDASSNHLLDAEMSFPYGFLPGGCYTTEHVCCSAASYDAKAKLDRASPVNPSHLTPLVDSKTQVSQDTPSYFVPTLVGRQLQQLRLSESALSDFRQSIFVQHFVSFVFGTRDFEPLKWLFPLLGPVSSWRAGALEFHISSMSRAPQSIAGKWVRAAREHLPIWRNRQSSHKSNKPVVGGK